MTHVLTCTSTVCVCVLTCSSTVCGCVLTCTSTANLTHHSIHLSPVATYHLSKPQFFGDCLSARG